MKSIIVDIGGEVTSNDPIRPFFYPLQRQEEMVLLTTSSKTVKGNNIPTASRVRDILCRKGWIQTSWQLIVLMPLEPVPPREGVFLAKGCQGDLLNRFFHLCLHPLTELHCAPERTVTIFCDSITREYVSEIPIAPHERRRFQLDTLGFIAESGDFSPVFSLDDIRRVNKEWPTAFELHGCRVDGGIRGLSDTLQIQLEERCRRVSGIVAELVDHKIQSLQAYVQDDSSSSIFLRKELLESISTTFTEELIRYQTSKIGVFQNYLPAIHLQTLLKERFSLQGMTAGEKISILRFPIVPDQRRVTDSIVELASLLMVLVESGLDIPLSRKSTLRTTVQIDRQALTRAMSTAAGRWQELADQIKQQGEQQTRARIPWIEGLPGNGFAEHICKVQFPNGIRNWNQWFNAEGGVRQTFSKFQQSGEHILQKRRAELVSGLSSRLRDVDNLDSVEAVIQDERFTLEEELLSTPYQLFSTSYDWPATSDRLAIKIRRYFNERSTFRIICLLLFVAFLFLTVPSAILVFQENTVSNYFSSENIALLLLVPLFSLIPLPILWVLDRQRLATMCMDTTLAIRQMSKTLQDIFRNNMSYVDRLSSLIINTRNIAKLKQERLRLQELKQRRRFFVQQLHLHCEWAEILGASRDKQKRTHYVSDSLDLQQPPLSQSCFDPGPLTEEMDVIIDNQGARYVAASVMPGLRQITFKADLDPEHVQ